MIWSNLTLPEQVVQRGAVGQVAVDELEGPGQGLEVAEVGLLEARVVEGIEVIEGPDGVAGYAAAARRHASR